MWSLQVQPTLPSVIDKYTSQHGVAAATQHFLRKLEEQGNVLNVFSFVSIVLISRVN